MTQAWGTLMQTLDRAVRAGDPAQLMIGGSGTVSVYPRQHCYVTDIQDWEAVYTASGGQIRVSPALWHTPPGDAQPLEELQWRAALHGARTELGEGMTPTRELVHLRSWPNLTRLPEEMIAPVTRICALLWRKPTVGFLVPRMLDLGTEQCAALLHVLQLFGHAESARGVLVRKEDAPPVPLAAQVPDVPPPASGVMSRLWQRLLRPGA